MGRLDGFGIPIMENVDSVFTTKVDVDNADIMPEVAYGQTHLKWSVEIEYRDFGIKDFVVSIPDQKIYVDGVHGDPSYEVEIKDVKVYMNEVAAMPIPFAPRGIEIRDGETTVSF